MLKRTALHQSLKTFTKVFVLGLCIAGAVVAIEWRGKQLDRPQVVAARPSPLYVIPPVASPQASVTPSPKLSPSPSPSPKPSSSPNFIPVVKTYVSPQLGVRFRYQENHVYQRGIFKVAEAGNTIFLYYDDLNERFDDAESDDRLKIFPKDPQESLEVAIKKKFLVGIPEKNCFITDYGRVDTWAPGRIAKVISYPPPADPNAAWWANENAERCPERYRRTNARSYFFTDSNAPDRFAFVYTGQESSGYIEAEERPWQDTIEFF